MKVSFPLIFAGLFLTCCGNGGPKDFSHGRVQNIVTNLGDQIHPAMGNGYLAWFDLEGDPNGACHVPGNYYNEDYDSSCDGVIKVMDLSSHKIETMSDTLYVETAPAITDGLVTWFCQQDNLYGLCVTPVHEKDITFFPELGYYNYNNDRTIPPSAYSGKVVWAEYHYFEGPPTYSSRIVLADLRTGQKELMIHLQDYPYKVVLSKNRLAWTTPHWDNGVYSVQLIVHDIETGLRQTIVENQQVVFGLAGSDNLLAWKQSIAAGDQDSESKIHVYFLDHDGSIVRASSDEALVSEYRSVAVADSLLAWIDYRQGNYQVFAYDLPGIIEGAISPANSLISANMMLAIGTDMVVWPDFYSGNFDLRMFRFW